MFSKFGKRGSITTRLTFFYSTTTFILITVIALIMYGTTIHVLHNANYQFLSDEIDILQNLLKNKPSNRLALEQEVVEVPYAETGSVYHYFIRILDDKKKIVIATPQMEAHLHNAEFFNQIQTPAAKESIWWDAAAGGRYLLMQAPAQFGNSTDKWTIQIALDVNYQHKILNLYLKLLVIVLMLGTVIAILLGYFIARRGMRSLYNLTETTRQITATSLNQRISPEYWPHELKTLGQTFNQMLDRIETAFLHLTQFSADLAHELRTPVNNMRGEIEIATSSATSVEEFRQVLASNLEELQRISQIIENLLFLARAENPQLELKKTHFRVVEEINVINEFYQAMADEKNITLSITGDAILSANQIMFRRLMSNLVSNAIKYTLPGGTVSISIKETPEQIKIQVTDTGIGIAQEHLPYIFHRFYRTDSARSHSSGGIGLGLAIAKSIMDLHQGSIEINSHLNQGSTVLVTFPKQ